MRLLLSTGVLAHNGVLSASACTTTLRSNRLSWVLAHSAEPLFFPLEDARMIHLFIYEIKQNL
jgi:hypothetical protein